MNQHRLPIPGVLVGLAGVLVMALVFTFAMVPGPPSPRVLRQIQVVHDSLLPIKTSVDLPALPGSVGSKTNNHLPRLEASVESLLSGQKVVSEGYRWGRNWVTVHRIEGEAQRPSNAVDFRLQDQVMQGFSLGDLEAIAWLEPGPTDWIILSDCTTKELKEFVQVLANK